MPYDNVPEVSLMKCCCRGIRSTVKARNSSSSPDPSSESLPWWNFVSQGDCTSRRWSWLAPNDFRSLSPLDGETSWEQHGRKWKFFWRNIIFTTNREWRRWRKLPKTLGRRREQTWSRLHLTWRYRERGGGREGGAGMGRLSLHVLAVSREFSTLIGDTECKR